VVILLLVPAFIAMLLAKSWFLAVLVLLWGLWRNHRLHQGDPPWRHPMVQMALAWLLVASPEHWPGRQIPASPYFGSLSIPDYTCLDMLVIGVGLIWFALSFLRAWGHRPRRKAPGSGGAAG
jgi:hypothetical protein